MRSNWKNVKLKDLVTLKRGYDLPKKNRVNGLHPIISSSGINGYHQEYKVKGPGVITGRSGQLGKVHFIKEDFWPLNTTLYVENFKGNDQLFVYYFLQTLNLENYNAGSSVPTLNRNHVHSLDIYIPEVSEQKLIGKTLSSLDEKIHLNTKIISNLKEIAQTLFKHWFIDFEFPNENGEPYCSSGGEMIESDLGWIPKKWSVREMGDFLTPKTERVGERDITEYSTTNYGVHIRSNKFKKPLSKNRSKNKVIEGDDIVFGMSREILNFGVMKENIGAVSAAYNVYSVDRTIYNPELLEMYMRSKPNYFNSLIKPGAREGQGIDKKLLTIKEVIVPSQEIQSLYYKEYKKIREEINALNKESNALIEIRDTLLPKLLSGEIELNDENEEVENALV